MGHLRLHTLPRTRTWKQVVALIEHGAAVDQVARATIKAAERGLRRASKDRGVIETVWLLTRLPHAAKAGRLVDALGPLGTRVHDDPGLMSLAAAVNDALDASLANNRGRTDLGEMAQMAATEALIATLARKAETFFDPSPPDILRELAALHTVKQFGSFAKTFFGRLTFKCMDYFLSRVLYTHVGEGRRFLTLARLGGFMRALEIHCVEAARYVDRFSGEWLAKTHWENGAISRDDARDLAHGAIAKLLAELTQGAA
jgi:hypothetical protein